jgi:site-specific recombinase XerD
MTDTLHEALKVHRHLRGPNVVCTGDGRRLTQKMVQGVMRRVAVAAQLTPGVHILWHSFCSHLAMHGAPARAIQELAGHVDLGTTQRYMHLTPSAIEAAIRLLDDGAAQRSFGDIVETGSAEKANSSR